MSDFVVGSVEDLRQQLETERKAKQSFALLCDVHKRHFLRIARVLGLDQSDVTGGAIVNIHVIAEAVERLVANEKESRRLLTDQVILAVNAHQSAGPDRKDAEGQALQARVAVLEAEARELRAAEARAQQKFEDIRVWLRTTAAWRKLARRWDRLDTNCANALDQIESLLPAEHLNAAEGQA